jgi:hypothetical protein
MNFLKQKVWPVVAGLVVAFVVMMLLEYINSFFFPLPADLDWEDTAAVQAFTASLPWTAYILVLFGWILASFKAGYVTTYLAGETKYRLSLVVGVLLTLLGIVNNMMIGHDMAFNIIGLPMFIIFTYLGHRYRLYARVEKSAV